MPDTESFDQVEPSLPRTPTPETPESPERPDDTAFEPILLLQESAAMTILAQDPEVRVSKGWPVTAAIPVPSSRLQPGPANHRFRVVDIGASGAPAQPPVLLHTQGQPWVYVDDWVSEKSIQELVGNPEFRAQHLFAVAAHTLSLFERHLGRRVPWRSSWPHLYLVPKGMLQANAKYAPDRQAVIFGYANKVEDKPAVWSCLSYDIVAHEVTHAILDGLRPRYVEPGLPDQLAFHEALADLVALLSVFGLDGVAYALLGPDGDGRLLDFPRKGEDREERLKMTALLKLGEELGRARARREGATDLGPEQMPLRQSVELEPDTGLLEQPAYADPHKRAEVLVAAVMHCLVRVWAERLEPLDPTRGLDARRVAEEGVLVADHLLRMVLRSLDYLPPVELEFGDVVDAIYTADKRLDPDDRSGLRDRLRDSFAAFGIFPPAHHIVDEDGMIAPTPERTPDDQDDGTTFHDPENPVDRIRYEHLNFAALRTSPDEVFTFIWNNSAALGIDTRLATRVDRVVTTTRAGANGLVVTETLADYTQWIRTTGAHLPQGMTRPAGLPEDTRVEMWGGGVLVFDQFGRFRLHQRKPVRDVFRQQRRLDRLVAHHQHGADGSFGTTDGVDPDERFALLHGSRSEDAW